MFEWKLPTHVVFGTGRFRSVHKLVRGLGKRAFVVTSHSFAKGGARAALLDELLAQLKRIGVETSVFSEIEPNPRTSTIDRAAGLVREFRPRYVIALGGGSVMDAAKCLALLAVNDGRIYEYCYRGPGQTMKPFNHALPVACIPTVAATGSETDFYAVVTNMVEHRKTNIFGDALYPAVAIIDPELTYTVPEQQTVDGAFDIITHVVESYLSSRAPTPVQDGITEAIAETVVNSLRRVLENPRDELGRSQLSWCSSLALSGVLSGRAGAWPIHAIENGLTAWTDGAHGRGLAFILPRLMLFNAPVIPEKIIRFNARVFEARGAADAAGALESGLIRYMKEVGAWTHLGDVLRSGQSSDELCEKTATHALEIKGIWKIGEKPYLDNCRPLYREDIVAVLNSCR